MNKDANPQEALRKEAVQDPVEETAAAEEVAMTDAAEEADEAVVTEEAKEASAEKGPSLRARVQKTDVIKFAGLVIFLTLCGLATKAMWPYIGLLFQEGGAEILRDQVNNAGVGGIFIILAIQLLQIIVAIIPGEVVQVAAGMVYGTWGGFAILVVGCIISSMIVFMLVRKLGAPFVQEMVPTTYLEKFRAFEKTGKLDLIVFVLFLFPGMPKDVFTYLVPLTDMKMGRFLLLATVGRMPAMLVTTFAANGLMEGDYLSSIIIFGIALVLVVLGIIFREKILTFFQKGSSSEKKS